MKRLALLGFWIAMLPVAAWGQSVPCLADIDRLTQLSVSNAKEGLSQTKEYYQNNRSRIADVCVIQLEYTLGFLELQNLRNDSANVYMDRFLSHSQKVSNDSVVVEGYLWYATFKRLVNQPQQTRRWLDSTRAYLQRRSNRDSYLLRRYYSSEADYYNTIAHQARPAETYYLKALQLAQEGACDECHLILNNLGFMFMNEGYLEKAAHYFYQSLLATEKLPRSSAEKDYLVLNKYLNLSFCYRMLHRPTEAERYARKALATARKVDAPNFLLRSLRYLAAAQMEAKQWDEALQLLKEAEKICLRLKQKDEMAYTYRYLGELYAFYLNDAAEGKWYLDKSKQLAEEIGDTEMYHLYNYSLGRYHLLQKNYAEAARLLALGLEQGRHIRDRVYEPVLLELLYQAYHQQGNTSQALTYYTQYISLRDSILADETQLKIKELEGKYNEKSSQLTINRLQTANTLQQAQIKKNRELIALIIGGGLLVLALLFLLYQRQVHKKKIAQQKQQLYAQQLKELEQQRQLEVYTAVLEGQETERARLARDLHDGLGGMLAGTKLYLSQINQTVINGQAVYLQTAVNQIDHSMQELRRIARNMMPETLRKFGLPTALKDLCEGLTHPNLRIQFQSMGLSQDMPQPIQLTIYRIVQELIANAIKHAEATEILVQCLQNPDGIHITVEDNGRGFEATKMQSNGIGLANVRNRVEYLKGRLEIQSEPKVGTTITIEIPT
jgi:signal transduction histidine kinase